MAAATMLRPISNCSAAALHIRTRVEFQQALIAHATLAEEQKKAPPSKDALRMVLIASAIPFVAFGFLDNAIMVRGVRGVACCADDAWAWLACTLQHGGFALRLLWLYFTPSARLAAPRSALHCIAVQKGIRLPLVMLHPRHDPLLEERLLHPAPPHTTPSPRLATTTTPYDTLPPAWHPATTTPPHTTPSPRLGTTPQLVAGEEIDHVFGARLGLSTLASAGLGNACADVVGVGAAKSIEVRPADDAVSCWLPWLLLLTVPDDHVG